MGIKEGTYCMEHWVLYENNGSWITTSKTSDVLYGDEHNIIKLKKKKRHRAGKKEVYKLLPRL